MYLLNLDTTTYLVALDWLFGVSFVFSSLLLSTRETMSSNGFDKTSVLMILGMGLIGRSSLFVGISLS